MKFEIIDKMYFYESIIAIFMMFLCAFLGIFIGKKWYKAIIKFFRKK